MTEILSSLALYTQEVVQTWVQVANALLPAYVISLLFFIGLLIRVPSIPHYWRWFIWVNPLQWVPHPLLHPTKTCRHLTARLLCPALMPHLPRIAYAIKMRRMLQLYVVHLKVFPSLFPDKQILGYQLNCSCGVQLCVGGYDGESLFLHLLSGCISDTIQFNGLFLDARKWMAKDEVITEWGRNMTHLMVQINQFSTSNLIVTYQGPVLPYFGIAQTANKWEWLGFEAVSYECKI